MCLIIYAPEAQTIPREHFYNGSQDNNDGIGVMSTYGVAKFMGRKKTKRAYAYCNQLAGDGIPYAAHFRYATHGRISQANTHPFEIPGTPYLMMHNGVLWTSRHATDEKSDTAVFAELVMPGFIEDRNMTTDLATWKEELELEAGYSKLLLLNTETGEFDIINALWGDWIGGLWYSNTYSLPIQNRPTRALTQALVSRATWLRGSIPMASGPTLSPDSDEEWLYQARLRDYHREQASKFDWHDRSTWDKYPLPGSWEDRFPLAEDREGPNYAADGDDAMDGVQQFI